MDVSPTALVVDDELDLAWALEQSLLLDGWRVITAPTGQAALAQAAVAPIRAAFIDAKLPDMDGLTVARRITALSPGATVVLISGYYYSEDQVVREALAQGLFASFISKPFDLAEISAIAQRTRLASDA